MREENYGHMKVFHPFALQQVERVIAEGTRFVHYTTAEAALSIIKNREVWMRKSFVMNDFQEVAHGWGCLTATINSDVGRAFQQTLDSFHPNIFEETVGIFSDWLPEFQAGTYLVSFSEHDDKEDWSGRLSMWRAYGTSCGVAMVMNQQPFLNESDALKAYTSPVLYGDEHRFKNEVEKLNQSINDNRPFVATYDRERLKGAIFHVFKLSVLCTKHPGFAEEREWRVFYTPTQNQSQHIRQAIETINGVPQTIQKIPLKNIPEEKLVGIEISQLLDRVIIGPCKHPLAVYEALVSTLNEAQVENAGSRVCTSDIPLRD